MPEVMERVAERVSKTVGKMTGVNSRSSRRSRADITLDSSAERRASQRARQSSPVPDADETITIDLIDRRIKKILYDESETGFIARVTKSVTESLFSRITDFFGSRRHSQSRSHRSTTFQIDPPTSVHSLPVPARHSASAVDIPHQSEASCSDIRHFTSAVSVDVDGYMSIQTKHLFRGTSAVVSISFEKGSSFSDEERDLVHEKVGEHEEVGEEVGESTSKISLLRKITR